MSDAGAPDSTAVRVALWRAMHATVDASPHVLVDNVGLMVAGLAEGWQQRPDMDPERTRYFRAAIVARGRYIEDLVAAQAAVGVDQYVILGAGLDSFAQRRLDLARHIAVFEVDRPGPQLWKRRRLDALALDIPEKMRFVPVDFEAGENWLQNLSAAGFNTRMPAVVASTGVSMYLTRDAVVATLREVAGMARGTTFAMTFMLPLEHVSESVRTGMEFAINGAAASGTPFISFFLPQEMIAMARAAGFREARVVTGDDLADMYFKGRDDGLRPPGRAEELLVATT